jgi:hypothetical protein
MSKTWTFFTFLKEKVASVFKPVSKLLSRKLSRRLHKPFLFSLLILASVSLANLRYRYIVETKFIVQRPARQSTIQPPSLLGSVQSQTTINSLEDAYFFREIIHSNAFAEDLYRSSPVLSKQCLANNYYDVKFVGASFYQKLSERLSVNIDPTSAAVTLRISCDLPEASIGLAKTSLETLRERSIKFNSDILLHQTKESQLDAMNAEKEFDEILKKSSSAAARTGTPSLEAYERIKDATRLEIAQKLLEAKAQLYSLESRQKRLFTKGQSDDLSLAADKVRGLERMLITEKSEAFRGVTSTLNAQMSAKIKAAQTYLDSSRLRLADDKRKAQEQSRYITVIEIPLHHSGIDRLHVARYFGTVLLVAVCIYLVLSWISRFVR